MEHKANGYEQLPLGEYLSVSVQLVPAASKQHLLTGIGSGSIFARSSMALRLCC